MNYRFFEGLLLRAPRFSFAYYAPERLPEVLGMPVFREALLLASPGFYALLEARQFSFDLLSEKERFTLLKYYNRMSFRPVPFGAFASFSALGWGGGRAQLSGERLHLFPDRSTLPGNEGTALAGGDLVGVSPLVYRLGQEYRFYRRALPEGSDKLTYRLDALAAERLTVRLLRMLQQGPQPFAHICDWVRQGSGCTETEAEDFVRFLYGEQVLALADPAHALIRGEAARPGSPALDMGQGQRYYAALEREGTGGPSAADRAELEAALVALSAVAGHLPQGSSRLERFKTAFSARFGDRQVPLLEALDPDSGIPYERSGESTAAGWTPLHRVFLESWIRNMRRSCYEPLMLTEADLQKLALPEKPVFPPTTAVLFRRAGDQLVLDHAGGATGTALPGRFSLFSDEVLALSKAVARKEMTLNPGVIFADIRGESGPHVDNINQRRRIYDHEIALDGCCVADRSTLVPADLLLFVEQGELVLGSRKHKKRVVPRLSTAFNQEHNGLGVFRLLCDLQYQGLSARLGLDLEALFPGLDFYPRLCYGRTVLAPAKWKISNADLPVNEAGMRRFRERYGLPQRVSFGRGDQQLVFDLAEASEARFFLGCVAKEDRITLTEYLCADRSVLSGHRPLAGQYLGLLYHEQAVYAPLRSGIGGHPPGVQRSFPPGSEWLYLKLYCSEASANRVLTAVVVPLLSRHAGDIDGWFFIRYMDPEPHIRLRLRVNSGALGPVLATIQKLAGRVRDLVRSFRADTYERELERYGAAFIGQAEQIFRRGSELVLAAVKADLPEMPVAVLTIYRMLETCLPDVYERLAFAARSATSFRREFQTSKAERLEMDRAYRELRPLVDRLMDEGPLPKQFKRFTAELKTLKAGSRGMKDYRLLSDLCHMQVNRSFAGEQRRNELLVWTFAEKILKGRAARYKH